ncbi:FixH family protein [Azospirillum fermentarium]|uniref:FixH family protein n=1 Tax=Azospirillum fermentarium TaxID=1233114 RepID=UPI0029CAC74A|nr:FixH family protein [Azospirillum fermentarium]
MPMTSVPSLNQGQSSPGGRSRAPGWYIPWIFVAAFMVVLAVNGVMIYVATSTYTGLETEEHFMKGIKYNDDLAGARAQAARAWKVSLDFTSPEDRKGLVAVTLHDKYGNLLKDARVTVSFTRPTNQGYDQTLDLPYLGEGRYAQPVEFAMAGVWDMRVKIDHSTGDYQDQKRVWVQ